MVLTNASTRCVVAVLSSSRFYRTPWKRPKYDPFRHPAPHWVRPLLERMASADEGQSEKVTRTADTGQPTKFLAVSRVRGTGGRPYWEKELCETFGVGEKVPKGTMRVHMNSPYNNSRLLRIKHLLRILPVSFPNGEPESEADGRFCRLLDNGEFVMVPKLKDAITGDESQLVPAEWQKTKVTEGMMRKENELKIQHKQVSSEFFPTTYLYRTNQDGSELRYNKDLPENREAQQMHSVNAHYQPLSQEETEWRKQFKLDLSPDEIRQLHSPLTVAGEEM